MADDIERLVKEAALDRMVHRKNGRMVDAAASSVRIVALIDALWIVDADRAREVASKVRSL